MNHNFQEQAASVDQSSILIELNESAISQHSPLVSVQSNTNSSDIQNENSLPNLTVNSNYDEDNLEFPEDISISPRRRLVRQFRTTQMDPLDSNSQQSSRQHTLASLPSRVLQRLLTTHRYLRRRYRYIYHKKCACITFLLLLVVASCGMNNISADFAIRLSLCLGSLTLFAIFIEYAHVTRESNEFGYFDRDNHEIMEEESETGQENSTNSLERRERVALEIPLDEIREYLHILNRQPGLLRVLTHRHRLRMQDIGRLPGDEFFDIQFIEDGFLQNGFEQHQTEQSQGLSTEQIDALLPLTHYHPAQEDRCGEEKEIDDSDMCCTICIENFQEGQEVRVSPCSHFFHPSCIEGWVSMKSVCPNCKRELRESSDDD